MRSLVGLVKNNAMIIATLSAYKIWLYHRGGNGQISWESEGFYRGEVIKLGLKGVIDTHQGRREYKTWRP